MGFAPVKLDMGILRCDGVISVYCRAKSVFRSSSHTLVGTLYRFFCGDIVLVSNVACQVRCLEIYSF